MSMKNTTLVSILGRSYRISSDSDNPEYIERAAAYLDTRMREAAGSSARRAPLEQAVLAAMEIADQVLEERRKREDLLDIAEARIDSFASRLEQRAGRSGAAKEGAGPASPP